MSATLTPTKTVDSTNRDSGFNGGTHDSGGGGRGGRDPERTPPPEGYRLAVWLTIASITMLFLGLTSAFVVNQATSQPITVPSALWFSTPVIIVSSITMELARRSLRRRVEGRFKQWLVITMILGLLFLATQLIAWRQLVVSGFYVDTNRHSGYAYLFTALHGLHLLGGLGALSYILIRAGMGTWTALRRRVSVDATALYWHFLDGLWVYLLVIVFIWR